MINQIRYLFITVALVFLLAIPSFGIEAPEATEEVGGTIPVIQKVFVSGEGYPDLFSSIHIEDFSRGFKETNEGKVILTVLSNAPWKLSVKGQFKPVGKYIKPASDLLVKIKEKTVIEEGIGTSGNFNEAFLDFGPLSKEDQALWMNENGGDHCRARIDYKLLLSSARDIPGEYSVVVTYTISTP